MTLEEIKAAVESGQHVFWRHFGYEVVKDSLGQWLIKYALNNHCIGLTWVDGVTLNGKPEEFFIGRKDGMDIDEVLQAAEAQDGDAPLTPRQELILCCLAAQGGEDVPVEKIVEHCNRWIAEFGEPTHASVSAWAAKDYWVRMGLVEANLSLTGKGLKMKAIATPDFDLEISSDEVLRLAPALIDTLRGFVTYGNCRQNNAYERRSLAERFAKLAQKAMADFPHLKLNHVGAKTTVTD